MDGGGGEEHVHPIVGVVGQRHHPAAHLVAPPVHMQVGLAVEILPSFRLVPLLLHHVEVLTKLLPHHLREELVHPVKGFTHNLRLQLDTVRESSCGSESLSEPSSISTLRPVCSRQYGALLLRLARAKLYSSPNPVKMRAPSDCKAAITSSGRGSGPSIWMRVGEARLRGRRSRRSFMAKLLFN